jgi:hypothetical protein
MDISDTILGTKLKLTRPAQRHIGSKSKPNTIYKYKQYIDKQCNIHHIYVTAKEIYKLSTEVKAIADLIQKTNNLDKQIAQITLAAEHTQCPKQHESEWSVVIHNQSQLCKYWLLVVKGTRNKIDTFWQSMEIFAQLPEVIQEEILQVIQDHRPMTVRIECYRQLRLANKYHKQLLRFHRELRHQSLLSLKEIRASEGNLEAAEILRKIIRHEIHNEDLAVVRAL